MVFKEIQLRNEAELESILKKNPSMIEENFQIIGNQLTTPTGRIDMLGVDSNGTLALVELKVQEDGEQLTQALTYYDWVLNNIDFIKNAY